MNHLVSYPRQTGPCLVLGNGRSAEEPAMAPLLSSLPVMTCNDRWESLFNAGYHPKYACYQDEDLTDAMLDCPCDVFCRINWVTAQKVKDKDNWYFFDAVQWQPQMIQQTGTGVAMGWTGFLAAQVAAKIGHNPIIIGQMPGWTRDDDPVVQQSYAETNFRISLWALGGKVKVYKLAELGPPALPIIGVEDVLLWL